MNRRHHLCSRPVFLMLPVIALQILAPLASAESLKERQARIYDTVQKVSPAVVAIHGAGKGAIATGSGVIVSKDGIILTAGHVLAATGDDLRITLPDGREVKAKALGRDMDRDAAMAQITDDGEWPYVELGKGNSVEQGEWCLALGHPGGYDPQRGAPLRIGRLWEADAKRYYRSDCTVSGGDSGGPLFDLDGKLIGIHSSISQNLAENRHVPVDVYKNDWDKLKEGEVWGNLNKLMPGLGGPAGDGRDGKDTPPERKRPRFQPDDIEPDAPSEPAPMSRPDKPSVQLGVTVTPGEGGAIVVEVVDGSPAQKAGIALEDLITAVGGKRVKDGPAIADQLRGASPGDTLKFTIKRGGEEKTLDVTLGAPR